MLRDLLNSELRKVNAETQANRAATLRLICTTIKDRELSLKGDAAQEGVKDADILPILEQMIAQREESAKSYEEAGQLALAEQEREEIAVIMEFLPRQLTELQMQKVINDTLSATGAQSIRDLGRVMGHLKTHYPGQLDFCKAGAAVKERLCNQSAV